VSAGAHAVLVRAVRLDEIQGEVATWAPAASGNKNDQAER
jgi:hypothetical protein